VVLNVASLTIMTSTLANTVDVLIPALNRSDTIERAVASALAQPEVRAVIVIDDGSTDDTAARAEQVAAESGRVVVRRLASNCGPSAARNRALEISKAPWVAVLDADDFLLPGRIGKMLCLADDWDFVADDILRVPASRVGSEDPRPLMFDGSFRPWRLDFATFVLGNSGRRGRTGKEFGFLKPLMRRSFLDCHQLRYDERLCLGEDYALYAHALARGAKFLIMPASGYVSVTRTDSLSARHSKLHLERYRDADVELGKLPGISDGDRKALRQHYRGVDSRVQWINLIEAVKSRSLARLLSPFLRSSVVSLFLARKLYEEIYQRTFSAFDRFRRTKSAYDRQP
jgi:succinoglycan biosynthesis protein ExoU